MTFPVCAGRHRRPQVCGACGATVSVTDGRGRARVLENGRPLTRPPAAAACGGRLRRPPSAAAFGGRLPRPPSAAAFGGRLRHAPKAG